jgi:RNA recognition motif-containing protein
LVKNLPENFTQSELNELFSKFGKIQSCKLEIFSDNKSKGFGYVQYVKVEDAQSAIESLNGSKVGDKEILVTVFTKKNEREEAPDKFSNLYVSNLPTNLSEDEF